MPNAGNQNGGRQMTKFRAAWLAPALIVFAMACADSGDATAEEGAAEAANPCAVEAANPCADNPCAAEGMEDAAHDAMDEAGEAMGEMADDAADAAGEMADDAADAVEEAANPCAEE
jgi:hypothetical protein